MKFPPKNTIVPFDELMQICKEHGLIQQIKIIKEDPPQKPFRSDGASCFPDSINGIDIYPAAFLHDIKYYLGYSEDRESRLQADLDLASDIMHLCGGSAELAEMILVGVRAGGTPLIPFPWRWGFGR